MMHDAPQWPHHIVASQFWASSRMFSDRRFVPMGHAKFFVFNIIKLEIVHNGTLYTKCICFESRIRGSVRHVQSVRHLMRSHHLGLQNVLDVLDEVSYARRSWVSPHRHLRFCWGFSDHKSFPAAASSILQGFGAFRSVSEWKRFHLDCFYNHSMCFAGPRIRWRFWWDPFYSEIICFICFQLSVFPMESDL